MIPTVLEQPARPTVPIVVTTSPFEIERLPWSAPWTWIGQGWRDLQAHPLTSLFYGLPFWCMALVLHAVFHTEPEYAMALVSGCLLVGPFVAMGLYDSSRRREYGMDREFMGSLTCWKARGKSMGMLTGLLIVLVLLWGRASLVVTALFFNTIVPADFNVIEAAFAAGNWEFLAAYATVGGVFASLAFTALVVAIPMILDRDADAISAAITSVQVVLKNTGVMMLWGVLIVVLVGASVLLPFALGLTIAGPLLGHATWHAYRQSVRWL
jgi:uncharacterized membrane protein